jgi:hypothetical protein
MTNRRIAFRLAAIAALLALTGCIFFGSARERAMRKDPNFQAGYGDGCASANARGTNYRGDQVRDDAAYQVSQPYRAGWAAGYSTCNNQLSTNPNPNVNGLPDQRPNP